MVHNALLIFLIGCVQLGLGSSIIVRGIQRNLCFKYKADVNEEVVFSYLVSGLNDDSTSAKILDPNNQILFKSNERSREGKLIHTAQVSGNFLICFDTFEKSAKSISFDMVKTVEINQEGVALEAELDSIRNKLQLLEINLIIANQNLEFKRRRSSIYNEILANTLDKLFNYSFIKIIVLIAMTLARAIILTKLVTESKVARV